MNQVILGGFERSKRERLAGLIQKLGYDVYCAPSQKRLREAVETIESVAVVIDSGLDGSGGVGLLASLNLSHDEHVVLVLGGNDYDQFSELISSENVSTIEIGAEKAQWRKLFDGIGESRQVPDCQEPQRFEAMLGSCEQMLEVYEMIARVAPTSVSVLICGESGTGKELVAGAIHSRSKRSNKPYVAVNCGAIAENLIESELFGHDKSAFTGADKAHAGVFEQADGGTLFLDEITEMPEPMQVRLLRVLESGTIRRVGSEKDKKIDVRVIAATNRDPQKAIAEGLFREDVHYRLAVFPFELPPLRERGMDVVMLANHFLSEYNRDAEASKTFSKQGIDRLLNYDWPGNVRQLRNLVQRAHILESEVINMDCMIEQMEQTEYQATTRPTTKSTSEKINRTDASAKSSAQASTSRTKPRSFTSGDPRKAAANNTNHAGQHVVSVAIGSTIGEAEKALIIETLEQLEGDKKRAAAILGISLKTLYNRLNEYEAEEETRDQSQRGAKQASAPGKSSAVEKAVPYVAAE